MLVSNAAFREMFRGVFVHTGLGIAVAHMPQPGAGGEEATDHGFERQDIGLGDLTFQSAANCIQPIDLTTF